MRLNTVITRIAEGLTVPQADYDHALEVVLDSAKRAVLVNANPALIVPTEAPKATTPTPEPTPTPTPEVPSQDQIDKAVLAEIRKVAEKQANQVIGKIAQAQYGKPNGQAYFDAKADNKELHKAVKRAFVTALTNA